MSEQAGSADLTTDTAADAIEAMLDPKRPEDNEPETDEAPEQDKAEDEPENDDEPPEDGDEPEQPSYHRVKVGDEELEVTLDELVRGYQRQSDYTRKTQEVAEHRKALEPELEAVRVERQHYAQALAVLAEQNKPVEPDWDHLRQTIPADQFAAAWADYSRHLQSYERIQQEQARVVALNEADQTRRFHAFVAEQEQALLERMPELRDPAKASEIKSAIAAYALDNGATPEEVAILSDHRLVVVLDKARKWDELQAKRPQVRAKVEQVRAASPGSSASHRPATTDLTKAKQRLAKTGKVDDAASAIEKALGF